MTDTPSDDSPLPTILPQQQQLITFGSTHKELLCTWKELIKIPSRAGFRRSCHSLLLQLATCLRSMQHRGERVKYQMMIPLYLLFHPMHDLASLWVMTLNRFTWDCFLMIDKSQMLCLFMSPRFDIQRGAFEAKPTLPGPKWSTPLWKTCRLDSLFRSPAHFVERVIGEPVDLLLYHISIYLRGRATPNMRQESRGNIGDLTLEKLASYCEILDTLTRLLLRKVSWVELPTSFVFRLLAPEWVHYTKYPVCTRICVNLELEMWDVSGVVYSQGLDITFTLTSLSNSQPRHIYLAPIRITDHSLQYMFSALICPKDPEVVPNTNPFLFPSDPLFPSPSMLPPKILDEGELGTSRRNLKRLLASKETVEKTWATLYQQGNLLSSVVNDNAFSLSLKSMTEWFHRIRKIKKMLFVKLAASSSSTNPPSAFSATSSSLLQPCSIIATSTPPTNKRKTVDIPDLHTSSSHPTVKMLRPTPMYSFCQAHNRSFVLGSFNSILVLTSYVRSSFQAIKTAGSLTH